MRLRDFDKYIKDKLLGYKPAYQEDIWKAIEEKLPATRVPNGQGSWLLVASAALVIVALVPFLLKFNDVANMRQAAYQNKTETGNVINSQTTASSQKPTKKSIEPSSSNQGTQTAELGSGIITSNHYDLKTTIFNRNKYTNIISNKGTFSKNHFNSKVKNETYSQQSDNIQKSQQTSLKSDNEARTGMNPIILFPVMADNELDGDLKNSRIENETGRYSDHGKNINNVRWANWQSIFYPFWQNPAYTGSEGKYNFTVDGKIDAVSNVNTGGFTNIHTDFAFDMRLNILGGIGIGLYRSSDPNYSSSLQTSTGLALSKVIFTRGNTSLKLGASFTSINTNYYYNSLSFSDQLVPGIGFVNATKEKNLEGSTQAYGINGGIWISNPHLMAGIDVVNINKPRLEHIEEAAPLPRLYRATIGYRFAASPDFQLLPMVIMTSQSGIRQANATITAVYKNKFMATVAYQNIDPISGLGNISLYAGCDINKKIRVFASHGVNAEYQAAFGINEQFTHLGIKYQIM